MTNSAPYLTAEEFAALADAQVGKPYVLGAEAAISNNNPPKFDCSELVEWLYGRNGTPIGDLAASQYDRCKPVTGSPKVGDLVFLKNNPARWNRVGHVAILTKKLSNGDWRVIEARGRAYGVVRSTLSFWKSRSYYAGLRRFSGFMLKTAPPVQQPDHPMRVGSLNTQAAKWDGDPDSKGDAKFMRDTMKCSVFFVLEAIESVRDKIRSVLGSSRFITWPTGMVSVMWDKTKFEYGPHSSISFGTEANRCMKVKLTSKKNGESFVAAAVHIRARDAFPSSWSDEKKYQGKLDDVRRVVSFLKDDPNVVVGGDWNTNGARKIMEAAGYKLATPWGDTTDNKTDQSFDMIYVKGSGMGIRNLYGDSGPGKVYNPGRYSDHKGVVANLTRYAKKIDTT